MNQTCLLTPPFAQILPNMQQYFFSYWPDFFTSGIGPNNRDRSLYMELKHKRRLNDWFGPKYMCSWKASKNDKLAIYCLFYFVYPHMFCIFHILCIFLNFKLLSIHIHRSHMEIGLSEVIKFCTRKMLKKTHFMSPSKVISFFQDVVANFP